MRGIDYCRLCKSERQEVLDQMRDLELCEFTGSIVLPVGHWEQIAMELAKRLGEWAAPAQPGGMPAPCADPCNSSCECVPCEQSQQKAAQAIVDEYWAAEDAKEARSA